MQIKTRREFIIASTLSIGSFVVSTGLSGCTEDNKQEDINVVFNHGVASGDPQHDRVILWTRFTPESTIENFQVSYEVSTDEAFTQLVRPAEIATVTKSGDYTLKVDFQNLEAGKTYYYRFKQGEKFSPIGKTKTLPLFTENIKIAVFSCANYPKGYFNVYEAASKLEALDVSLHLGDYIYEYGMFNKDGSASYATENAADIGRVLPVDNETEAIKLEDYRKRYALYRTDKGAQALHSKVAMIAVWDDHEIANDAYKYGAKNHDQDEGEYELRKQAALQAYFEWMPIRPAIEGNNETIYRSFDFGSLLSLHMLDTRIISRDKQLTYTDYPELLSANDSTNFLADLTDQNRHIIGSEQLQWLQNKMSSSNATWQILGQQVLMGRMQLPAELLVLIGQLDGADAPTLAVLLPQLSRAITELTEIKMRHLQNDPALSEGEKARITTVLPYNLDAWDGYFNERETILQTAHALNKNLIVLSGDTHNGWANNLKTLDNTFSPTIPVGVELACASVSSPGMEEYVNLSSREEALNFEAAISLLIDDLVYFNAQNRGFIEVNISEEKVVSIWNYVDNISSRNYQDIDARKKELTVEKGSNILS